MATLPAGTRMDRVDLGVGDLRTVVPFYTDTVGLEALDEGPSRVDLGVGTSAVYRLVERPDRPPRAPREAGLFHAAVRVPDRPPLAAVLGRLRASGRMTGASDHHVSEALYARDPEDNGVEVYRDRPREDWEATADGGIRIVTWPLDLEDLEAAADPAATDRLPEGTSLGHVHLEVTDLDAARAFYVDALGFEVTAAMDGALFVAAGGYHHHLGLNVWNRRRDPVGGRGLERVVVGLPGRDALDAAADRLAAAGYDARPVEEGVAATDPDGVEVVLSAD